MGAMSYADSVDRHFFDSLFQHSQTALLTLAIVTLVLGIILQQTLLKPSLPSLHIPLPLQAQPGWRGKVLEKPSITVNDGSAIQCYCPATGQLLDTIRAASKGDVDIAIQRAKAAQLTWCKTSFKERAKVLTVLLKFILAHQGIRANVIDAHL
jgi:hypothetical protein